MNGMNKSKVLLVFVSALCIMLMLTGCGNKKIEVQKNNESRIEKNENAIEKVAKLYEEKIITHKDIDFAVDSLENEIYEYKYAFVHMNDDKIPELIIKKIDKSFGLAYNKIFYYEKKNDRLLSPSETITTGVAGVGGFRGELSASNKHDGILLNQGSSGNGQFEIIRIKVKVKKDGTAVLENLKVKEYVLGDENVNSDESMDIIWYKIDDLSAVNKLKDDETDVNEEQKLTSKEKEEEQGSLKNTGAKVDNKTVFQGTLKYLSYKDVLKLQSIEDPNSGYADTNEKFALLVFDKSINVTATSGDGQGSYEGAAKMIKLGDFGNGLEYHDKKIKVKISKMYWPSDTSLPIGEPYALNGEYKVVK